MPFICSLNGRMLIMDKQTTIDRIANVIAGIALPIIAIAVTYRTVVTISGALT